ncbi:MAG: HD-GYP domain-containing protein [Symbiobacterium sp.]|uniref:HD-GYP domain-containing protein n=1 Tax=Symbiobacterium sp. TaxID=1971213 RepID=UPI003463988C
MYRVPTTEIRTGMRLGKSIFSVNGQVLLQAGTVLKESLIEPLLRYGITSVYIVNELAPDVEPVDVVAEETRYQLQDELSHTMDEVKVAMAEAAHSGIRHFSFTIRTEGLRQTIDQIIADLLANPRVAVSLQDIRLVDQYTLSHSVNVCILATLLGMELGYPLTDLRNLALGTLLHDIGKVAIPPEILNKPGSLTREEAEVMKQHTVLGWELLKNQPDIPPTAAVVALQHHERWAGGGYPHNLSGDQIFRFSRVCAIVDCYDAMTSDRIYRKGLSPAMALESLSGPMHGFFDPHMLLTFLNCIAPWPVGSMVELTGGRKAVVVAAERGRADRPRVRVLLEADGTRIATPYEIDLFRERHVEIVREVHEDALQYMRELAV